MKGFYIIIIVIIILIVIHNMKDNIEIINLEKIDIIEYIRQKIYVDNKRDFNKYKRNIRPKYNIDDTSRQDHTKSRIFY